MLGFLPPTQKPEWFRIQCRSDKQISSSLYWPTSLHYASVYCALRVTALSFHRLKVCGNPAEHVGATFPKTSVHFVSLCHVLVTLTIFPTFSWLLFLLQWAVIFDANTRTHSHSDNSIFNQSTFKLRYIHCVFRHHVLQHTGQNSVRCKSNFYMHRETKKFPRLSLLRVSLYYSGLEPNAQHLQGLPIILYTALKSWRPSHSSLGRSLEYQVERDFCFSLHQCYERKSGWFIYNLDFNNSNDRIIRI